MALVVLQVVNDDCKQRNLLVTDNMPYKENTHRSRPARWTKDAFDAYTGGLFGAPQAGASVTFVSVGVTLLPVTGILPPHITTSMPAPWRIFDYSYHGASRLSETD